MHLTVDDVMTALAYAGAQRTPPNVLVRLRAQPIPLVVPAGDVTPLFARVPEPPDVTLNR